MFTVGEKTSTEKKKLTNMTKTPNRHNYTYTLKKGKITTDIGNIPIWCKMTICKSKG